MGESEALRELISAAREGCDENCQDWRYRPAWRQRLWAAVRAFDADSGHVTTSPAHPVAVVKPAPVARVAEAPKPRSMVAVGDLSEEFARFWAAYPQTAEGGPLAAQRAYIKARKLATAQEILEGIDKYPFRSDARYQPKASKWLDDGCWMTQENTTPKTILKERNGRRHEAAELAEEIGLDLITPISSQFPEGQTDDFPSPASYVVAN